MKKIIFCNYLKYTQKKLATELKSKISYFLINYDKQSIELKEFLNAKSNCKEIEPEVLMDFRQGYSGKFIEFIGKLNINNNHSTHWWAFNFTNKNPLTTALCGKIFYFLLIVKLINQEDISNLLLISDDINLLKQLNIWSVGKDIEVINAIQQRITLKRIIKNISPFAVIFAFLRIVSFKFYARSYLKLSLKKNESYIIVLSLLNQQSFTNDGCYRDAYFGDFVNSLKEANVPFINLMIVNSSFYRKELKKVYSQAKGFPILTVECFLTFFDLITCLFHSLVKYFSPAGLKGSLSIDGIDLSYLVTMAIREDYISTYFFDNLRIYYAIGSLTKKIKVNRFYYPFENRSFEKMAILALRKFSASAKIIGYQHASISLRHTNFLLYKEEHKITPLPNLILTMGEITRDIMQDLGNFPKDLLRVGCALRQSVFNGEPKNRSKKISNILVALASNLDEYVKVLKFLNKAFLDFNPYRLWLRPHPVLSLDDAIKLAGGLNFKFHKADKETLDECYQWADILLYVHSTLSIESIMRGIPVLHIAVPDTIDPDPLFNFNDFKWRVENPQDLILTINRICFMDQTEFIMRQKKAYEYAKKYICKEDDSKLEYFLKC